MRSPSILHCRRSTLLVPIRCVFSRRFINTGQGESPHLGATSGPCRRVDSRHDPRYSKPVELRIRRLDYVPQPQHDVVEQLPRITKHIVGQQATLFVPGSNSDEVEQLPRITKHIVGQRAMVYTPGSPPPIKIIKAVETTEVRKIPLGPSIKRSFIRRTFHPLDKRSNVIGDGDTVVRLVRSAQDPFPELRETSSAVSEAIPGRRSGSGSEWGRLISGYLSIEEHAIDRPEVKTTYVDTHCHLSTALRILKSVGTE